jgi:ribosome biogenesis protein BMS1
MELHSRSRRIDPNRLIYGESPIQNIVQTWREYTGVIEQEDEEENIEDEDDDNFFKKAPEDAQAPGDGSMPQYSLDRLSRWKAKENIKALKHRFMTFDILQDSEEQEAEIFGDFEDLEQEDEAAPVTPENPRNHLI